MHNTRCVGGQYEAKAAELLRQKGYDILDMNYACKTGEIDIVASKDGCLVFCEVKYRKNTRYGYPSEAVDHRKADRIRRTAEYYLVTNKFPPNTRVRFDVIAYLGEEAEHIEDAF